MATPNRGAARLLGGALVAVCLAACAPSAADPRPAPSSSAEPPASSSAAKPPAAAPPEPVALATDRPRQSPGVVAAGGQAPYNYGPTLLAEGGGLRMWWCSQLGHAQPPGDDLLYAQSASPDGPFGAPDGSPGLPVLSGNPGSFDGVHTCDPSVLHVGDTYYLYYTGAAGDHAHGNAIGVATSPDGVSWTRAAGGAPIVSPSYDTPRDNNTYGAGQPAALYLDGWFYLMFTDTTGKAAGWNGAGQFVLRSKDPTFAEGVQSLGLKGFFPVANTRTTRTRSVVDAFSADWMWIAALDAFAIAHETGHGTSITFWSRDFSHNPHPQVHIPGPWREGPGLVRTGTGHAPVSAEDPCGRIALDVVRATTDGGTGAPSDLAHYGLDVAGAPGCRTAASAGVLDGYAVPSPENTVDLVVGGEVVRVERRSVADRLAAKVLDRRPAGVDELPVAARVPAGAKALRAPDGQVGLLLEDDALWLVPSAEVAALNSSAVTPVSQDRWDSYAKAGDLRR